MGEGKSPKSRSFLEDLVVTFSSPMAWLLVMALILTWSGVAIVLFDLLDYKTLADYTSYCDDPKCLSPGLPPASALGKKMMRSKVGVKALKDSLALAAAPEEEGEAVDWTERAVETAWAFLASLVAPDDEEEEGIHQLTEFTSILSEEL